MKCLESQLHGKLLQKDYLLTRAQEAKANRVTVRLSQKVDREVEDKGKKKIKTFENINYRIQDLDKSITHI